MSRIWKCEFCGQAVVCRDGHAKLSPEQRETCLLWEHVVGNECIGYRDPATAVRILQTRNPTP